jgi:iron complex outermembrane receptor protein
MEIYRGLAPVSVGPETMGGAVRIRTRTGAFQDSDSPTTRGNLETSLHSVDRGSNGAFFFAHEGQEEWSHAFATQDRGENFRFGGSGEVTGTEYLRSQWGLGFGKRIGGGSLRFDARRQATDNTGTPSLPMDIMYFNTDMLRLAYEGQRGASEISGKVYYTQVNHLMDNYTLRPPPNFFTPPPGAPVGMQNTFFGTDRRQTYANSQGLGFDLKAVRPVAEGELRLGADLHLADHDGFISDPDSPFRSTPFAGIERDRASVFGEWEGPLQGAWDLEVGLRVTRVSMHAGLGITPAMPSSRRLFQRFAAGDRDIQDLNLDLVARFLRELSPEKTLEISLGRKTRSPSYVERFAYLPSEATSGYADTNNTVGDLNLDPEAAHTLDIGLSLRRGDSYFTPRVFYTRVHDFIQQIPTLDPDIVATSQITGDPTPLQFANVSAHYWGGEAAFGKRLRTNLRLDGTLSYARGRRRDISDNLFRMAPLHGTLSLTRAHGNWDLTAQGAFAAAQNHLSATNSEPRTPGHGVLNLFAQRRMKQGLRLTAGVENVLDLFYKDHLSGFNRVQGSQVGSVARPTSTANRIPGAGRNFFLRVDLAF